jgi:hypothetical protein
LVEKYQRSWVISVPVIITMTGAEMTLEKSSGSDDGERDDPQKIVRT